MMPPPQSPRHEPAPASPPNPSSPLPSPSPTPTGPEQLLLEDARKQWGRMATLPEEARRRRFVGWLQVGAWVGADSQGRKMRLGLWLR